MSDSDKKLLVEKFKQLQNKTTQHITNDKVALGYIRVSTDIQVRDGCSLEAQEHSIIKYCSDRGLECRIYKDEGKSGKNTQRPELLRMLGDIEKDMTVITYSISRLSRSVSDFCEMYKTITEDKGAKLVLLDTPEISGIQGKLMLHLLSAFSEFERSLICERTKTVMNYMSEHGTLVTKPKYGYKLEKNETGNKILVAHEEEQLVIEYIRCMIRDNPNITISAIARTLKTEGFRIRNAIDIYPSTIRNIIRDNNLRSDS